MPTRSAQKSREALSQIAFGCDRRQFEAAVQDPVNEGANHCGAGQGVASVLSNDLGGGVKPDDLSVK
jgi:hypothetical protein